MKNRKTVAVVTAGATMLAAMFAGAQTPPAPGATPLAGLPALPAAPAAVPPAPPTAPAVPGVPTVPGAVVPPATAPAIPGATPAAAGLPALPALPGTAVTTTIGTAPAFGAVPGVAPAAAVPTPPPLGNLSAEATNNAATETTASVSSSAAPAQLYTFLFIEDPEYGVVRQKFNSDVADQIKENEIQKLQNKRMTGQGPQLGMAGGLGVDPLAAMDPALAGGGEFGGIGATAGYGGVAGTGVANNTEAIRAAAEWDFYYDQLEMYDRYVREKLVPNAEDLPELAYDAANALQERQDLFESFQEAAITQNNDDTNDNQKFYERLQKREDRRVAYHQWIMHKQNEVAEWAEVWARQIFGTRWADGEEVRVDDWYYGTDFNSAKPVYVAMDDRQYIVSREPVEHLQQGQLNVISSNLTPYDIIDNDGYLKNPVMETLRGTLVIPPAAPIYSTATTTGTIEVVGGSPSE